MTNTRDDEVSFLFPSLPQKRLFWNEAIDYTFFLTKNTPLGFIELCAVF